MRGAQNDAVPAQGQNTVNAIDDDALICPLEQKLRLAKLTAAR